MRTRGYLSGGILPKILLSFRSAPYGDEQAHADPYVGLRVYGPYKPVKTRIIHLISKEWIEKGILTRSRAEYFEQRLKNHFEFLFEKSMKEAEWEKVEIDEVASLTSEDPEKVHKKEEEVSKVINKENCIVLTFIPPLFMGTRHGSLLYSKMKILGLKGKNKFIVQCYSKPALDALEQEEKSKFIFTNLALNIFAKSGGIPWILSSSYKLDYNLVMGAAWSIKTITGGSTGPSIKYYGVTHIFDERGTWKNFVTYACRARIQDLLNSIVGSLKEIIHDIGLHEGAKILLLLRERPGRRVLQKFLQTIMTEIRFLRADIATVSEGAPVRVYNTYTESYLPPRGLFFEVSDDRAYMITTGIYEERYTGMGTPKPIKVELLYTTENNRVALRETVKACYALTAMNWRNLFGSLRLPTPIHYAKLMARLLLISSEDDIADAFIYLRKKIKTEVETEWDLLKPVAFQDRPWFI